METNKILTYTAIFEKAVEGGYVAYVPVLPGCVTQGESFEEAKDNIKDAISGYVGVLKEDGDEVPAEHKGHIVVAVWKPEDEEVEI